MKKQSVTLALFEAERVVAPAPVAVPTIEPDTDLEPGDEEEVLETERLRDVDAIAAQLVGEFARIEREDVAHATESRIVSELRPLMRQLAEARAQFGHEDEDGELDGEAVAGLGAAWREVGR